MPPLDPGALAAAQIFQAMVRAEPDILPAIGRGEFGPLMAWLRKNVHGRGSSLPMEELLTRVTGEPLYAEPFKAHLRRRYLDS